MESFSIFRLFFLAATLLLGSCGGGGGGETTTSSASASSLSSRILNFRNGPKTLRIGDVYLNKAVGLGTGNISYVSSDPQIARVDNGLVSAVGPGIATITATIDSDGFFSSASAQYVVEVLREPIGFTAHIGDQKTTLQLFQNSADYSIYKIDPQCADENISNCSREQKLLDGNRETVDVDLTLSQPGNYILENGTQKGFAKIAATTQLPRNMLSNIVVFKNQMVVVTGKEFEATRRISVNSIYASSDGVNWELKSNQLPMAHRRATALVVFKDKLWLIGGSDESKYGAYTNDVWTSADGVNWTEVAQSSPFTARQNHNVIVFNDKIWIVGGVPESDVWGSEDGANWSLVGQPTSAAAVIFKDKIWGFNTNKVMSSTDWVNWTLESEAGPKGLEPFNSLVVFQNKLWAFPYSYSPISPNEESEIWTSSDGINWAKDKKLPAGQVLTKAVDFKNRIWLVNERSYGYNHYTVSSSLDGSVWQEHSQGADFPSTHRRSMVGVDDKLLIWDGYYLMLSYDGLRWGYQRTIDVDMNDYFYEEPYWVHHNSEHWFVSGANIFSTKDGVHWKKTPKPTAIAEATIFSFKGTAYALDRISDTNRLFSSPDGKEWTKVYVDLSFPKGNEQTIVPVKDRVVMFGGWDEDRKRLNDVWVSEDAKLWTKASVDTIGMEDILKTTSSSQGPVVSFQDKLWYISEYRSRSSDLVVNNLWISDDGVNWRKQSLPFSGRSGFKFAALDQKLWVIGGTSSLEPGDVAWSNEREVWSSEDGINWVKSQRGFFDFSSDLVQ